MPKSTPLSVERQAIGPDYSELIKFLIQPLLESGDTLVVDCEKANQDRRIWIRVAFSPDTDKGRVFGRGGRNIQAINTIVQTAAKIAEQSVYLDIYGNHKHDTHREMHADRKPERKKRHPRHPVKKKTSED